MTAKNRKSRKRPTPAKPKRAQRKPPAPVKPKAPRQPITGARLWIFRAIALTIIPAILLIVPEFILRITGYGNPTTAMVKDNIKGKNVFRDNSRFSWQFFPWNIAREATPYVFDAKKSPDAYRIFVLGASAAQGTPDPAFAFSRILEVMLENQYPSVDFEIINTAMVATNSHVVRKIAKDCSRHNPDMYIVYLGNNEVVGPFGAGTVFSPLSGNLGLIRLGIAFKSTRTGQLFSNILAKIGKTSDAPAVWTGMDMFLDQQVRANDKSLQTVYSHFQNNLTDITDIAIASGAEVVLSTVGSNLKDNPPFASLHRPDLTDSEKQQWQQIYDTAIELEQNEKYSEAIEKYIAAAIIDTTYADLHFRMATCYEKLNQFENARKSYINARQHDTLRFRTETNINSIIKNTTANNASILLADSAKALQDNSPNLITDSKFFYEHVHLNFTGNYLVAKTILQQVEQALPENIKHSKAKDHPLPTEQACKDALAYTILDEHKNADEVLNDFIKRPPFSNQLYHEARVESLEANVQSLKAKLTPDTIEQIDANYKKVIARYPDNYSVRMRYAEFLTDWMHNDRAAANQYKIAREYLPYFSQIPAKLGMALGKQGDIDSAIALNKEAIKLNPAHVFAHYNLGFAYMMRRDYEKALAQFSTALKFKPDHAEAWNNTGAVLYQQGKIDEAIQTYRKAIKVVTDYEDLNYNLAILLQKKGKNKEAIEQFKIALEIKPDSKKIRTALNKALSKQRK